ncbi:MAG: fibronectin type III domain-containing protein, partial [Bacteroidales bacterium]
MKLLFTSCREKSKRLIIRSFLLLSCFLFVAAGLNAAQKITGKSRLITGETAIFSVPEESGIKTYEWVIPNGCYISDGINTNQIRLTASFMAQNGILKVVRTFENGTTDESEVLVTIDPAVKEFKDHSIKEGESVFINDQEFSKACIYYENIAETNQKRAHRITYIPTSFTQMTKPYLQSAASDGIWISWKTNFSEASKVIFGAANQNMDNEFEASTHDLSENTTPYFWHSARLTGLQPNTLYSYKVRTGDKESETYTFRTMPEHGSKKPIRILLMGDHQIKARSGYEWLCEAARQKIEEKYGDFSSAIQVIMNDGDQVDVGTLDHYEHVHLYKSETLSPYVPIMTAVGNHETYSDPGMEHYKAHFHYEDLSYQGISSNTDLYYAYQVGRLLFVVLSTEHTGSEQESWVRKVAQAAATDENVDFMISVNHRPIQAEQYIGDISTWVRDVAVPILSQTEKHVLNYSGHHHLYHRGQLENYPLYHIINGGASWDQMWGMSSEKDYDDVQKTIDYWGYQILEFDFENKEMKAECYAIGNREMVIDNMLIDSFHRKLNNTKPIKPALKSIPEEISLPYTFMAEEYDPSNPEALNSVQFQFATDPTFDHIQLSSIQDIENLYGSTGKPLYLPVDLNADKNITNYEVGENKLKNGVYYVRVRYRDRNVEWSDWSDAGMFRVTGSIEGDPAIAIAQKVYAPEEQVTITYNFAPLNTNAWIGVYKKGDKVGSTNSIKWSYTSGLSGKFTFSLSEKNEYFAVLFQDGGYTEITERIPFMIGTAPKLTLEKTQFDISEEMTVHYTDAPQLYNDWIGVYKVGEEANKDGALSVIWNYLRETGLPLNEPVGSMVLNSDSHGTTGMSVKGYYYASYFLKGGYFEPGERVYFSVGEEISTVSADKEVYTTDEEIVIHYSDGPGTPKDYIGFFKVGETVGVDELDAYYYTYGATRGDIVIPAGELPVGDYFCSLYIYDSY